jgi:hypothetical protein
MTLYARHNTMPCGMSREAKAMSNAQFESLDQDPYKTFLTYYPQAINGVRRIEVEGKSEIFMDAPTMRLFVLWADEHGLVRHRDRIADLLTFLEARR